MIGIDPSLNSTAISVLHNGITYFNYQKDLNFSNKWIKELDFVNFREVDRETAKKFSEKEIQKLNNFDKTTDQILADLSPYFPCRIKIEGYSQASRNGRYQDLVEFGTILRWKLKKAGNTIEIITPKEVKVYAGKLAWEKDKKGVWRNNAGVAAGSFKKWEMFDSLIQESVLNSWKNIEDESSDSKLRNWLIQNGSELKGLKNLPKPVDDLIDSEILVRSFLF